MRPLRLELEGFTSYRKHAEINFDGLDLFVISGPTGSGKSSLVDAIAYALYGRVPRVGAEIKDCIAQGLDRMWVVLDFVVGEQRYRVFRSTSRRGQATARLDAARDGQWDALEGRAQAVNDRVKQLVGLDYDAFTRSVLLPQGQFQLFLAGEPQQRRRVLQELLRLDVYARVATRAGQLANEARNRAEDISRRLREDYAEATPEALREKRRLQRELAVRLKDLEDELRQAQAGQRLAERLARACADEAAARQALQGASAGYQEAKRLVDQGEEETSHLSDQLETVREAIEANPFDPSLLADLKLALAAARDLDRLDDRLETLAREGADLRVQAAGASEALGRAQNEQAAAEEEMHLARQKLEELRRQHAADYLRHDLRAGDPCPVCLQAVGKVPLQAHPPLEQTDARVKEAERGERQAREAVTRAEKALSALKQSLVDRRTQMDATRQERDRKEAGLLEQLPPGQDRLPVALQAAVQEKESARADQEQLDRERQGLETELREKERLVNQAKQELSGLEASVRAADEALRKAEAEVASLSKDLSELAQARVWTEVCERLAAGRDPLLVMAARAQAAQQARDDAAARLAVLKDEVDRLARDIQRVKELRGEEEQRRQEWTVARELADLLRADRFQAFVQEEALRILAEDGTRHLEELSGGRYAFDVRGQEFLVADRWNADETRSVKTLSGGETFLASLALALALAERLPGLAGAQGQVTLESLFLDEGFGTLDVETLEVVAQALEALRSGNRMVCLITHIGELAERMPARIEVVKTQSGSHIAVS